MYADAYNRITQPLREHPAAARALMLLDRLLVGAVAATFVAFLAVLALTSNLSRAIAVALTCALGLLMANALRSALNRPRPVERFPGLMPLLPTRTRGRSLPSRHAFSAWVIALSLLEGGAGWAAAGICLAVAVSASRVLGGAHAPRDVAAGAVLAALVTALGHLAFIVTDLGLPTPL
ncbi:phosphatase PAP2 family protein [Berryella wangjianweii]|uniref:Phosphatase PAP2 family protein n=1 Tax=Berryella wangjianweii TaxID=2734634 RepID=A0A6M8J269_9ACTN|nr:phosphatase PAP2 family protein [Berryella wangjianweii]QKF07221.1 phosphatase PAP2 family protein [Berryella wangjianweii]